MGMMLSGSFPPPAKKQPAPTQAEKDAARVDAIRKTALTRKAFDAALQNEGFNPVDHDWQPPSEEVRQSLVAQWIQRQKDALGITNWNWPRLGRQS